MRKPVKIAVIFFLFLLLVLVRAFAPRLFYDPFMEYFKNDYLHKSIPIFITTKLFLNILMRYSLNFAFSLAILYVAFQKKSILRFSAKFYAIIFIVFVTLYYILLQTEFSHGYLLAFYVRRFLIHPLFVLILLPAFYFQKKEEEN